MKKIVIIVLAVVVAVLCIFAQPADKAAEKEAITQSALDYIEGWFEGNAERMDRALHPQLAKRMVAPGSQGGQEQFIHLTKEKMVEATGKGGGQATPADKRDIKVTVLDVYRDMASVRVDSVAYIDFLHLTKSEGKWKIINVLWLPNVKERKEIAIAPEILAGYAGEYELSPQLKVTVTAEGGRIFAQGTGQPKVEIFAESETVFFLKVAEAQITFLKDEQGRTTGFVLHQGGAVLQTKKVS